MRAPKMTAKMVTLVSRKGDKQSFELQNAEKLLDLAVERGGGWKLPPDSEYTYTYENGIRLRPNKGNTQKAEQEAND